METYILKTILCSSIFIGLYFFFLEKEKMHRFNRFFLLSTILFSLIIPLLSINYGVVNSEINGNLLAGKETFSINETQNMHSIFSIENILIATYFIVSAILLLRFSWNLISINREIKRGEKQIINGKIIILKTEPTTPHSFLKYIFLNKADFKNGKIDPKIIVHESAHIQQFHSFDILLIEFLLVAFWFNPAFYFYKKAILTNHEFLADEEVLKNNPDFYGYKKLLLNELATEKLIFSNQFNLNNTKKRFIMMTKKPTSVSKLKKYLILPVSAILFFTFVEKIPAQKSVESSATKPVEKFDSAVPESREIQTTHERKTVETVESNKKSAVTIPIQTDTIKKKTKIVKKEEKSLIPTTSIAESYETKPLFPDGTNAFRMIINKNFDTSIFSDIQGLIKTEVTLTIDDSGNVTNITAEGNNEIFNKEAKRTFAESTKDVKFIPATKDGKNVASSFKMPLTMVFSK